MFVFLLIAINQYQMQTAGSVNIHVPIISHHYKEKEIKRVTCVLIKFGILQLN